MPRHVIRAQQFSRTDLEALIGSARTMERLKGHGRCTMLDGKIMATVFYEPSTRTRMSFESAMYRLGGEVITTENAKEFSSAAKGERLEDSIRVLAGYADVIVLRHYEEGSAERAAKVSDVPVINAGDGAGQHPTQAILDLFTIAKEIGGLDGLTVACCGDLAHGRTVRSLVYLLSKFNMKRFIFVAPEVVRMRDDIKAHLDECGIAYEETDDLNACVGSADVIYQTRIQKERFGDRAAEYAEASGKVIVNARTLGEMRKDAIVMHPLPRVDEIDPAVDEDKRAAYFRQARYGVPVRMALVAWTLHAPVA